MHSDIPESYPSGGKGTPPNANEQVEVGCSLDYALIEPVQCQCSVALKNRFKDFFYDRPSRLIAIPGPHRQLLVLKEHNPYVGQLLQRLNSNPINTLNLNEWLSDPSGRLAQLIQPVNCAYKNSRAFLSFPPALWKAGLGSGARARSINRTATKSGRWCSSPARVSWKFGVTTRGRTASSRNCCRASGRNC